MEKATLSLSLAYSGIARQRTILALGPELKANFTVITRGVASVYDGFADLKIPECYARYRRTLFLVLEQLACQPDTIIHDGNPHFFSSRFAVELQRRFFPAAEIRAVQHHQAHLAAALADLPLRRRPVIGVACDGTGWGEDGRVWGFEIFTGAETGFTRYGHAAYLPLPGGDQVVAQPWRSAVGMLFLAYGEDLLTLPLPWLTRRARECRLVVTMIRRGVNTPWASSAGRLFDGISALLDICQETTTEAQAPRALEAAAATVQGNVRPYTVKIRRAQGLCVLDIVPLTRQIVADIVQGTAVSVIALRFHQTVIGMIAAMCRSARRQTGLRDVVVGGGLFFNQLIRSGLHRKLAEQHFRVHEPVDFLLGDSGISLGQAVMGYVFRHSGAD